VRRAVAGALLAGAAVAAEPLAAGEIPGAVLVLEAAPGTPGSDPAGAPARFVLLRDGRVFVGGTARLDAGQLEKREADALLKRAEALRKLPGIRSPIAFGARPELAWRLRLLEDDPLDVNATGDPATAPPALLQLASLVKELERFEHASLRPYAPSSFALSAREARLVGGCREWSFSRPLAEALAGPRVVPAAEAEGWPTGALPASVCAGDKRVSVTLRPLLPDEQP
jgi:hypothetical protein